MSTPAIAITGCSSGFGRVTALRFLRDGWRVVATARQEADRLGLIEDARALGAPNRLAVVLADITRAADVAALRDAVAGAAPELTALVNNAGTAFPGPLELLPLDDLRAQFEINVVAHVAVTQALLPFLKAARGTIINVSSVSGRVAPPYLGAYSASKFALEALSDASRVELAPLGVRVVVIEPGSSPTQIWGTSRARAERRGADTGPYAPLAAAFEERAERLLASGFPPELFADTVARIVSTPTPRARYAIPGSTRRAITMRRFLSDRFLDRRIRRALGW
jgi:NAD(P)-dependent dehydrogenase (short-subunit alcohol dehydrogenase family)